MDVARVAGSKEMDIIHLTNLEEQHCLSIIRDELSTFSDPEKVFHKYCNYITLKSQGVPHIAKYLCFILRRAPPFSKQWQLLERDLSAAPRGTQNPIMEDELDSDLSYEEESEEEKARQPTTSFVHAATIHGRDDVTGALIGKLLSNDGQAERIQFISIVGGAGIGKTAVTQLVYNTPEVENYFDCRAWVFVGEEFNLNRIIRSIIESVTAKSLNETDLEALLFKFRQTFDHKRCLFVLDDIWLEDDLQWEELKQWFHFTDLGSRTLITTRNKGIADRICSETNIVLLDPLSVSACWSIIKDYAFGHSVNETKAAEMFNEVGKDIVQKCNGVPLMAKSLGNILRGKNSIQEWQQVLASETWDSAELLSSVMLSYLSMPPELRQVLLYCSVFPKNHSIDVGKLIKLWMAQGFIASDENEMEREGWKYIKQLLDRNIFEEFNQDSHGCFKCKLESGMSDLIHFLAKNESHRVLIDYMKEARVADDTTILRHCTLIIAAQSSLPEPIANAKKLRTLMILSEYFFSDPTTLARVLSHLKVVRALDLSSCLIKELPSNIGELLLLRYLDLSFNRDLKKLPKAICGLLHLQTLNLNGCDRLQKLPKGIGNLIKLRHLEILWTTSLSYLPKGVANLTLLRTLSRFIGSSVAGSKACNLGDLKELNLIQGSITIDGLGGETCVDEASKACLKNKKDLLGLELCFSSVGSEINHDEGVLNALEAPPELQCLEIFFYRGQLLPDWMKTLRNLRHLVLAHWSKCSILPSLGHLLSLESLEIRYMPNVKIVGSDFLGLSPDNAVSCDQVSSSIVAFPRLQKLCFEIMNGWEDWSGNGSHANIMPLLSALSIENCPKLRTLPQYILEKKDLKRDIKNCPVLEAYNNNSTSNNNHHSVLSN
ncbi:putative disease resistance protein RGA1 [Arachis duranensis]|uniref:Disease resistance protein RGA1 n=1 Tax=Arachis duranensis TaxID=130453 RepID=A0A9C6TFY0_ARADU|nr:putative disease resistance protein RGA1 [Arachis duranensis]